MREPSAPKPDSEPAPAPAEPAAVPDSAPAPISLAAPIQTAAWKRNLFYAVGGLLALLLAVAIWRLVGALRVNTPAKPVFVPLRIMGAPPLAAYATMRAQPLPNATVQVELFDAHNQPTTTPQEQQSDSMGAVNLHFLLGSRLLVKIRARGFAEREMWLENPRPYGNEQSDFTVTLDRAGAAPRKLPLSLGWEKSVNEPFVPLENATVTVTLDPAPPVLPDRPTGEATPPVAVSLTTDALGQVELTWLPNRGVTVQVAAPGFAAWQAHFMDAFDYERRYPHTVVLLKPLPASAP